MRFSFVSAPLLLLAVLGGSLLIVSVTAGIVRARNSVERFFPERRRREIRRKVTVKSLLTAICLTAAFLSFGMALFSPSAGETRRELPYYGRDIMFCIDISNSMTAADLNPSRLEAAKVFVRTVAAEAENSSIGITVFKGNGAVAVPLTGDKRTVDSFLEHLSPGYSTVPGTNVEEGLKKAASGFSEERPGKGYIFLLSDGEGLEGNPFAASTAAKLQDFEVWTFMTGTEKGEIIRMKGDRQVRTMARPDVLYDIAERYGGEYINISASGWWDEFAELFNVSGGTYEAGVRYQYVPRNWSFLFILFGVFFLLFYIILRIFLWKKEL